MLSQFVAAVLIFNLAVEGPSRPRGMIHFQIASSKRLDHFVAAVQRTTPPKGVDVSAAKKYLLLYPGISADELHTTLKNVFSLDRRAAGLLDAVNDVYFPLTMLSREPSHFAARSPCRIVAEEIPSEVQNGTRRGVCDLALLRMGNPKELESPSAARIQRGTSQNVGHYLPEQRSAEETSVCNGRLESEEKGAHNSLISRGGSLEEILEHLVARAHVADSCGSSLPTTSLDTVAAVPSARFAALREDMKLCAFPVDRVMDALSSAAASDGKLSRAEFSGCLRRLAKDLGFASPSTANEIFGLFDGARAGILNVQDMAAGLAMLCQGCTTSSFLRSCRLYQGGDSKMGFSEISAVMRSLLKVLYAATPVEWARLGMVPRELSDTISSDLLQRRGLAMDARVHVDAIMSWFKASLIGHDGRSVSHTGNNRDWVQALELLKKLDVGVVMQLLSAFNDARGGVSLPAFCGCIRALVEVEGAEDMNDETRTNLKAALKKLHGILDVDGQGIVPVRDLASGVSTFCGDHKTAKIRALSDIFGNEDGSVTERDTRSFFGALFKVLLEIDPGAQSLAVSSRTAVNSRHLAETTAAHAFADAALSHEGLMSFDEFHRWHSSSMHLGSSPTGIDDWCSASHEDVVRPAVDVEGVHCLFRLRDVHVSDIVDGLTALGNDGRVSWMRFARYMCTLARVRPLRVEACAAVAMARKIFEVFDEDDTEEVDLRALASGLSVLCKGSWRERVACLWKLLDTERRGSLTREDMQIYFCATFKLLCSSQPKMQSAASPEVLAKRAVEDAFKVDSADEPERFDEDMLFGLCAHNGTRRTGALGSGQLGGIAKLSFSARLTIARRDSKLGGVSVMAMVAAFGLAEDERGRLSRRKMHACLRRLRAASRDDHSRGNANGQDSRDEGQSDPQSDTSAEVVVDGLFDALDVHRGDRLDSCKLASGLSVLCGGTQEEKMEAMFKVFDAGSGGISRKSLATYLTCVFRVVYKLQPGLEEEVGMSAETLGRATSARAMDDSGSENTDLISASAFRSWNTRPIAPERETCSQGSPSDHHDPRYHQPTLWNLAEHGGRLARAREVLCLNCFLLDDLMEMFAEVAATGVVSGEDFWRCISYVLQLAGKEQGSPGWSEARSLAERIHGAFKDSDGVVDFAAITSGLSVLCESSMEEKVFVAFELLDSDGDGRLSFREVAMYMISVLRVVYAVSEALPEDSDAEELGTSLAVQCFRKAHMLLDDKLSVDELKAFVG